jgi:hypothetical protein
MVPGVAQHRLGTVGAVGELMTQKPAIDRLNALGMPELREIWRQSGGRNSPPYLKCPCGQDIVRPAKAGVFSLLTAPSVVSLRVR